MTLDDLIYKPGLLAGQRVLVTGGGTGLGRVMSEALLLLGAEIHICGRRGALHRARRASDGADSGARGGVEPLLWRAGQASAVHHRDDQPLLGGAEGDRTPDLIIANDTLSQLSYCPNDLSFDVAQRLGIVKLARDLKRRARRPAFAV